MIGSLCRQTDVFTGSTKCRMTNVRQKVRAAADWIAALQQVQGNLLKSHGRDSANHILVRLMRQWDPPEPGSRPQPTV